MQKSDMNILSLNICNIWQLHGVSGQTLASHHWGPEFASWSLHVAFVLDETGSG